MPLTKTGTRVLRSFQRQARNPYRRITLLPYEGGPTPGVHVEHVSGFERGPKTPDGHAWRVAECDPQGRFAGYVSGGYANLADAQRRAARYEREYWPEVQARRAATVRDTYDSDNPGPIVWWGILAGVAGLAALSWWAFWRQTSETPETPGSSAGQSE